MSMFTAGDLDQRITVEREDGSTNALGERTGGWVEAFQAWARVRPVRQSGEVDADRPMATGSYRFIIRAAPGQDLVAIGAMRIKWGGGTYYVNGEPLRIDGPRGFMQIMASSGRVNDV